LEILNKIKSSEDVKQLPKKELEPLCAELREEIIQRVSKSGGHLASNLGAVELSVALHRVYDTQRDRLVFDVGHQCYAHKMLTGRREDFSRLRMLGGISGFPKPAEAADDACISGHASTSISNALGMARARTLKGEDYSVVVLIGDGAMTGGLAFEGISDCGQSGESIVVVLNDNNMSIGSNVGGIARLISNLRVRASYMAFKRVYRRTIGKITKVYNVLHTIKEWVKDLFLPDNMFEDMGFYYLGPLDGHDVNHLETAIGYAKSLGIPVLLHVVTAKGRGYAPAETSPGKYHGVGSFDAALGAQAKEAECFSQVFGQTLTALAKENPSIAAITAAMEAGVGLENFAKAYPERFFDVGIAEGHAVSLAAGMAKQGLRPVFAVYSSFLQRAYDMLIHDVALSNLPVVLAVDRAGIVGSDGETHNGVFDIAFLRSVPSMKIFAPSNHAELRSMLSLALAHDGPSAVRYARGSEGAFVEDTSKQETAKLCDGADITIVSYGILINEALAAAEELRHSGINAAVFKLNTLDKPQTGKIIKSAAESGRIIIAEEACQSGCLGTKILSELVIAGAEIKAAKLINLGNGIIVHGEVRELWQKYEIDSAAICRAAREMTEGADEKNQN